MVKTRSRAAKAEDVWMVNYIGKVFRMLTIKVV